MAAEIILDHGVRGRRARRGGGGGADRRPPILKNAAPQSGPSQERHAGGGFGGGGIAAIVGLAALGWFATGIYTVQPNEAGIETVFGRFTERTAPGLNYNGHTPSALFRSCA